MSSASQATEASIRWQQATITEIVASTPRIKSFVFKPERPFVFRAGQHVDVRLTAPDGYRAERSYSIASAPGAGETFELAIERLDDGEVSPFFHDIAEIGDAIEMRGPIGGHFVWRVADEGPVLLIGGGSGIVPLLSMVRHRAAARRATPFALIYSARTWSEVLNAGELTGLAERGDGLALAFALTREDARREQDFSRRIDVEMVRNVLARLPASPQRVFVCGSNPFVEAATNAAIDAGLAAGIIRTERYGG